MQRVECGFFGRGIGGGVALFGSTDGQVACVVVGFEPSVQCGVFEGLFVIAEFSEQLLQVVVRGDVFRVDVQRLSEGLDGFFEERFSLDGDGGVSESSGLIEVGLSEQVDDSIVLAEVEASLGHFGRTIFEHALEVLPGFFELIEVFGDEAREPGDGPCWRWRVGVF